MNTGLIDYKEAEGKLRGIHVYVASRLKVRNLVDDFTNKEDEKYGRMMLKYAHWKAFELTGGYCFLNRAIKLVELIDGVWTDIAGMKYAWDHFHAASKANPGCAGNLVPIYINPADDCYKDYPLNNLNGLKGDSHPDEFREKLKELKEKYPELEIVNDTQYESERDYLNNLYKKQYPDFYEKCTKKGIYTDEMLTDICRTLLGQSDEFYISRGMSGIGWSALANTQDLPFFNRLANHKDPIYLDPRKNNDELYERQGKPADVKGQLTKLCISKNDLIGNHIPFSKLTKIEFTEIYKHSYDNIALKKGENDVYSIRVLTKLNDLFKFVTKVFDYEFSDEVEKERKEYVKTLKLNKKFK